MLRHPRDPEVRLGPLIGVFSPGGVFATGAPGDPSSVADVPFIGVDTFRSWVPSPSRPGSGSARELQIQNGDRRPGRRENEAAP